MTSRDIRRLPSRARVSTDVRRTQSRRFIHTFVLPSGERLPLLVDRMTGAVCQLAARWATLERRDRVAASTILADQRALRYLYDWADTGLPCPLDAYFIDGRELTRPSIWGLSTYIKTGGQRVTAAAPRHPAEVNGSSGASAVRVVQSPPVFNNHWSKLALFIYWVTGMYARAGAEAHVPEATIDEARARMKALFAEQFVGERVESPVRVLDDEEIVALRRAIALDPTDVEAERLLVLCLQAQGRSKEALTMQEQLEHDEAVLKRVNQTLKQEADSPVTDPAALAEVGLLFLRANNQDLAHYWLKRALERDPDYQPALAALVDHYDKIGQPSKADAYRRKLKPAKTISEPRP